MNVFPIRTRIFHSGDSLINFIVQYISHPKERSIIVVTSKIVALAQGRVLRAPDDASHKERAIRSESAIALPTPWCVLTQKDGEWCANAGIDESNADGSLILLPRNVQKVARELQRECLRRYRLRRLGVIITDTRTYPLRVGTMGTALGYAGFAPLKNYIDTRDLFGRRFKHTKVNIVNALAVSAVLVMGEGAERCPLAVIEDAHVTWARRVPSPESLAVDPREDLYYAAYTFSGKKRGARSTSHRR